MARVQASPHTADNPKRFHFEETEGSVFVISSYQDWVETEAKVKKKIFILQRINVACLPQQTRRK